MGGLGFRGLGFRVGGLGFRVLLVKGAALRVWGSVTFGAQKGSTGIALCVHVVLVSPEA